MPNQTTFPNGMVLNTSGLSIADINTVMQQVTCFIFGIANKIAFQVDLVEGATTITLPSVVGLAPGFIVSDNGFGFGPYGETGYGEGGNIAPGTFIESIDGLVININKAILADATADFIFITDPRAGSLVRQSWPQLGQPGYKQSDDVTFISCIETDDWYNKVPDQGITANDDVSVTLNIEKTRVWRISWELRGPTSYDRATLLKTAMQLDFVHDMLAPYNLYLIPNVGNPHRMPELFEGAYWERSDISMNFCEQVNDSIVTPVVGDIPITVSNANGVQLTYDVIA